MKWRIFPTDMMLNASERCRCMLLANSHTFYPHIPLLCYPIRNSVGFLVLGVSDMETETLSFGFEGRNL